MSDRESDEEDFQFDAQSSDVDKEDDAEVDEDLLEAVENATSEAGSEGEHVGEDEEDEEEDEEDEDEEPQSSHVGPLADTPTALPPGAPAATTGTFPNPPSPPKAPPVSRSPEPRPEVRPPSPAALRRAQILSSIAHPRSYTVEAICAIPHPGPTHCISASMCFTHLLTGSQDGYVRNYDIFTAANSKNFLTSVQRAHCNVMEGSMKAGQLRYWWENPALSPEEFNPNMSQPDLGPIFSIATHSDALWTLTGSDKGRINLFTTRHSPGQLCYSFDAHQGVVSAMALQHDEAGLFSAGWDGFVNHWDLNTGLKMRDFMAHGAQVAAVALRPLAPPSARSPSPMDEDQTPATVHLSANPPPQTGIATAVPTEAATAFHSAPAVLDVSMAADVRSEASYDPLFDELPDPSDGMVPMGDVSALNNLLPMPETFDLALPTGDDMPLWEDLPAPGPVPIPAAPLRELPRSLAPQIPPLLEGSRAQDMSPDVMMTAYIDGQVMLWDRRVHDPRGVGRLPMSNGTPPWCVSACWSATGSQIYAGRRNGTIDVWDVRYIGTASPKNTPRLLKTIRNPSSSGMVSCVLAFPDGKHLASASHDNIRLWNVTDAGEFTGRGAQFKIVPGHHGGAISQMIIDPTARFLISASSDRGWQFDNSTNTVLVHDVKHIV